MKIDFQELKGKAELALRQNSPQILVISGIIGLVGSGVLAVLATKNKLPKAQEQHQKELARLATEYAAVPVNEEQAAIQNTEEKKLRSKEQGHYIFELTKIYAPSVILAGASISSILAGNEMLRRRNLALAAAYATLDNAYKEYRGRVIDRFGENVDKELRYGTRQEKIETTETDENGKEKKVKKLVKVAGPGLSGYARYFGYGDSTAAEPNADYNDMFLRGMQKTFNQMLKIKGFVTLNEVYEALGYKRTVAGQTVGWVYDRHRDDHGDNYIDLRIEEVYRACEDRPGQYERVFVIDPNVDGDIMNHLIACDLIEAE